MKQAELIYKKAKGLSPFAYIVIDRWLYFCDQNTPALFRYHFDKKTCECVVIFDKKHVNLNFYKILENKSKLWLLPFLDGKIICFDMITNKLFYYDIPEEVEEKTIPFFDMIFDSRNGYIIPHGNNRYLIKIDLKDPKMHVIELVEAKKNIKIFFRGTINFQNKIYLIDTLNDFMVVYDIDCEKVVKKNDYLFHDRHPKRIDNKIYFFPISMGEYKNVLIYDIETDKFCERRYPIEGISQNDICITEVFNNKIWILANQKKKIYKINSNLETELEILISNFNKEEKTKYVSSVVFSNMFFWNGHVSTPLIQIKDDEFKVLDVCENTSELEIYMNILVKKKSCNEKFNKFNAGKLIYEKTKLIL